MFEPLLYSNVFVWPFSFSDRECTRTSCYFHSTMEPIKIQYLKILYWRNLEILIFATTVFWNLAIRIEMLFWDLEASFRTTLPFCPYLTFEIIHLLSLCLAAQQIYLARSCNQSSVVTNLKKEINYYHYFIFSLHRKCHKAPIPY